MNLSPISAETPARRAFREAPPERLRSWRWSFLAALLLAVPFILGDGATVHAAGRDITGLTLASSSPGELVITWDANSPAPVDYRVSWAPSDQEFLSWRDENTQVKGNAYPTEPSHTVSGLPEGDEYKVLVRARYGSDGSGPWSAEATVTIAETAAAADPPPGGSAVPPAKPQGLISAVSHDNVLLAWDDPDDDTVTGYQVLRGSDSDNLSILVNDTNSSTTSYGDASVDPETTYAYAVRARNANGLGPQSDAVTVTTLANPDPQAVFIDSDEPLVADEQSAVPTLLSNLGQSSQSGPGFSPRFYVGAVFTTGMYQAGYLLSGISLDLTRELPLLTFDRYGYNVTEGSTVNITATLSHPLENDLVVPLNKRVFRNVHYDAGGASESDYSIPDNFTIRAGETTAIFTVRAEQDSTSESTETVAIGARNTIGFRAGGGPLFFIRIFDDDSTGGEEVVLNPWEITLTDDRTTTYQVSLRSRPSRDSTTVLIRDSRANDSLTIAPSSLTFTQANWNIPQQVTVTAPTLSSNTKGWIGHRLEHRNTAQDYDDSSNRFYYQSFSVVSSDNDAVGIYQIGTDGQPGSLVTSLAIPDTLINGVNGFAAPTGTKLSASTTYAAIAYFADNHIDTTSSTSVDDADVTGWTIGQRISRSTSASDFTTAASAVKARFAVQGYLSLGVTITPTMVTVTEGSTANYTVQLATQPLGSVTVNIVDPSDNTDVTAEPASLTFTTTNWNTAQQVTVTAAQDADAGDETATVTHTVSSDVAGYSGIPVADVVVNVDDNTPGVKATFGQTTYTVAEGSNVSVKVNLSTDPQRTVTIPITKTNQGGATSADYSGVPDNVVFNSGETEKTITFAATADTVDDDDESVKLGFGTLPMGIVTGTTNETTVSITDDDVPSVTVSFEQSTYTVAEGSNVSVKVKLNADPERTVTIPITKTNQGGATSADYSRVPANVVFNSGETEKTFTFAADPDRVDDDNESVLLGFGNLPTGVTAGTTSQTTVSITDDGAPSVPSVSVTFEQSTYTVAEGSNVSVKVKLNADPERTVTIPITKTNQGGATSADYSGVPDNVVFNTGETEKTITFAATADSVDDDSESVKLGFGNLPTAVTAGTTDETTVSITDDDVPSVSVTFEQSTYTVAEGSNVSVKVKLNADPERTVTIPITKTNQGGATSADYSGVADVVFNTGETEKTITFAATADSIDDDNESVKLGFGTLPTGVSAGTTDETTVSITDDDVPSVTVTFEQSSYTVAEGSNVSVKVKLNANPERTVTIPITKTNQGGATSADYSGVTANVVFNTGETEKTITFAATQDSVDDDNESVKLGFGTLPTRVSAGTTDETTVSITDDDVPSVTVTFEQSAYTVAEGSNVSVKVNLNADPERTVTIPITKTNQGGATSADYSGVPANVVFSSGETEKTIPFAARSDSVDDDDESVKLGFGNLPTGVTAGTTNETTVSITDDDVPSVRVSFERSTYTVAEGSNVSVKVKLNADPERTVTIPITKTNQGGATSADYSGVPSNVVFNSGETEKTITFGVTSDSVDDDDESVKLGFGNLPTGVTAGTTDETTVSITDDDVPSVRVSFERSTYTVAEGSNVTVAVELSSDPFQTVVVPITVSSRCGATNSDYTGVPTSVTFNAGETRKTFPFSAAVDTTVETPESVTLAFGMLPSPVAEGSQATTIVSILEDRALTMVTVEHACLDFPGSPRNGYLTTGVVSVGTNSTGNLTAGLDTRNQLTGDYWLLETQPGRSYRLEVSMGAAGAQSTGGSAWIEFIDPGDDFTSTCCESDHKRDDGYITVHFDHYRYSPPGRRYFVNVATYDKLVGRSGSATYHGPYTITLEDITGVEMVASNLHHATTTLTDIIDPNNWLFVSFTTGAHSAGYKLDRVDILSHPTTTINSTTAPYLGLHSDSSGNPGDRLCEIGSRIGGVSDRRSASGWLRPTTMPAWSDCAAQTLAANTTYWLAFREGAPIEFTSHKTYQVTETGESAYGSGWTIGDKAKKRAGTSPDYTHTDETFTLPVRIWATEQ